MPVDFASPAGDNEYVVEVSVKSGAGTRELEAVQTFIVRVTDEREPPEAPEMPTFSGETADSLRVSWSEPDNTGPPITDYDVQVREEGRGGFTDAQHDGPGLSLTLSDLEPGTVYEVQVRATNEEGTSGWSDPGEGMTVTPLTVGMGSGIGSSGIGGVHRALQLLRACDGLQQERHRDAARTPPAVDDQPTIRSSAIRGSGHCRQTDDRVYTTTVTPQTDRVAHSYTLEADGGGRRCEVVGGKQAERRARGAARGPGGAAGSAPEPISSLGLTSQRWQMEQ